MQKNERMGLAWLKAGIWELRGSRRGFWRERCTPYLGEEDAKNINAKMFWHEKVERRICMQ
jgi:hypothetical protein